MELTTIDMTGERLQTMIYALSIALTEGESCKVNSYSIKWEEVPRDAPANGLTYKRPVLHLLRSDHKTDRGKDGIIFLPHTLTILQCADMSMSWLKEQDYGKSPDTDGDCHKGYRVRTVFGWLTLAIISPAWIVYGK